MDFPIGFMQGRLSPLVDGRIQAFPWDHWRSEFGVADSIGFTIMEWTLNKFRLSQNPLMTHNGRLEIKELARKHSVSIPSVTCDFFMERPFFDYSGSKKTQLLSDLGQVISSCYELGIRLVVIPVVDNSSIQNTNHEVAFINGIASLETVIKKTSTKICFESDYQPGELKEFIGAFDPDYFGINYDIGNSASLGYDPSEEIECYGERILNVHVKDRLLSGTTVPLGQGNADFKKFFTCLRGVGYEGNFILQTARATNNDHVGVLSHDRDTVCMWLREFGFG